LCAIYQENINDKKGSINSQNTIVHYDYCKYIISAFYLNKFWNHFVGNVTKISVTSTESTVTKKLVTKPTYGISALHQNVGQSN
jgi:hypothetical protein